MSNRTSRPQTDEYSPYFGRYVAKVPAGDLVSILRDQIDDTRSLVAGLSDEASSFAYAPAKWSIREVIGHMSDTERVMAYRIMVAARGDNTPLPSFDENAWTPAGDFGSRSMESIWSEFEVVRAATVALLDGLPDAAWTRRGIASGHPFSVRAMACNIAGHERHHLDILKSRYGLQPA
jgi:DinB superfamily